MGGSCVFACRGSMMYNLGADIIMGMNVGVKVITISYELAGQNTLTFKRRIKSHLPFAGVIRNSPYSSRFQDKG